MMSWSPRRIWDAPFQYPRGQKMFPLNVSIEYGKQFERGQGQVRAGAPAAAEGRPARSGERFPCSLSLAPEALVNEHGSFGGHSTWTAKATPSTRKARWLCRGPVPLKPSRQQSPGCPCPARLPGPLSPVRRLSTRSIRHPLSRPGQMLRAVARA